MAEALHKTSDIPNFDTYPATPALPAEGETVTTDRSALEQRAGQAGATIAKAAAVVRNIGERLRSAGDSGSLSEKVSEIADQTKVRAQELGDAAAWRAEEWGRILRERVEDLRRRARHQFRETNVRARRATREYPVQVALAAGAAGFLIGVLLRIRRASRA